MAYRTFKDSRGTQWQAWDVVPRLGERRTIERRQRAIAPPHSDRRSRTDRRMVAAPRAVLTRGMDTGWLCFEADAEKRRLTPIPDDWMQCGVERLERYCAKAAPARRITTETTIIDLDH